MDHLLKSYYKHKDSRGQGVKGSRIRGFEENAEELQGVKDLEEVERMLKALVKSLENKHLNP